MPAKNQPVSEQRPVIEFKSGSITVPSLTIASGDLPLIAEQLHNKVQQAPEFFNNSPVLLDLRDIAKQQIDLELDSLLQTIAAAGLITVGIRGGTEKHHADALANRVAVFSEPRGKDSPQPQQTAPKPETTITPEPEPESAPAEPEQPSPGTTTKLITQPIRSGQRVYSKGDLIILAQVSAGAEIMAEGNIHVYGSLRGRALAGVLGNTESRIFCSDLQAELISIAGHYRVSEDLDEMVRGTPVQIYLQDHALIIDDL